MHSSGETTGGFSDGVNMPDDINAQVESDTNSGPDAGGAPPTDPGTIANAAAKNQLTRFSEKVLPTLIANAMKPLMDEIAALKAPKVDTAADDKKSKASPEVEAMKAKIEELTGKFTSEQTARQAAEQKARDDRGHNALRSELSQFVNPALLNMLTDNLFHQRKVVEFDDDGNPLFKTKRPDAFGDLEDVRMPLKDGVAQYLKSEEAKAFLPAPSGGSNAAPLRKPGSQVPTKFDLSTASDSEKIRYAREVAARAEAKGIA